MPTHAVTDHTTAAETFLSAYEKLDEIIIRLRAAETQGMTHSEVESWLEVEGRELLRRLLQAHLDERSPGTVAAPVVGADGQGRRQQRLHTRHLTSIFGPVEVKRAGYGGRRLNSLPPLDAELNLPPEVDSHGVRRRVAAAAARHSFDEVVAEVTSQRGAPVPKRQAEQLGQRAAQDFEAF